MRHLALISMLFLAFPARAQSAETWIRRWRVEQGEASVTLARLRFREVADYSMEGGLGTRSMQISSEVVIDRAGAATRAPTRITTGDETFEPQEGRGRRRLQSPVRRDLQVAADMLLFPARLLREQTPTAPPDTERVDGRNALRLLTRASDPESPIERVTWYFSRRSGRLVRTRSIVRGDDRGTLVVVVNYQRSGGLDLPVSRELEGSFATHRRTRTFTVLIESTATFQLLAVENL
jgi:hypothetical protein